MKKWIKITIGVISSIIILMFFGFLYLQYLLRQPLPEYSGEKTFSGISSEIEIYRDSSAIPYIFALTETDAAFALGYLHAQERLFQMDLMRRAGEGRLSEVMGIRTVPFDKMFKTIGIFKHAEDNFNLLSPTSKRFLEAYTNGVNEYILERNGNYSIEFDLLGYNPYSWKPEHSLVISKLMAWELNLSWWSDIAFTHLIQKFGKEKVKEILPDYPENAPTIIPDRIKSFPNLTNNFIETDKRFREFMGFTGTHIGSNNWVVNGKLSSSGKPIIANDPHLAFQIPGKWYVAVIRSDTWNVEGFTLPGVPGVVIGKNEKIAWALTNVMADDADFYIEKLDSTRTEYFVDDKWQPLKIRKDTILVKDESEIVLKIRDTHRGPIISDVHPNKILYPNDEHQDTDISMRWTALEFSDELLAFISVNKAGNWKEFKEGVKHFTSPGQNFIYADVDGNIGYLCGVKLPIRKSVSPTLVYDGTTSENDWQGFVPFHELPQLYNPNQNYIASANNKTIKDFKYHISNIWEPSSRIDRITELIKRKSLHSKNDFKEYQLDFYSAYAKDLTKNILYAFEGINITDENLKLSLELLKKWDFVMHKDSQTPTIFNLFLQNLMKNIFEDEMGINLLKEYIFVANIPYKVIPQLFKQKYSNWFDKIDTPVRENRDDIIRKSLANSLDQLEEIFGDKVADWQWGEVHKITFKHFFNGFSSLLDPIVNVGPYSIGGDGTTIFNTEYSFPTSFLDKRFSENKSPYVKSEPFENDLGPSMRFIYDFANPNEFEFILPTGQSGHIFSDHYSDMTHKWLNGEYIRISLNEEQIKNSGMNLLRLMPE